MLTKRRQFGAKRGGVAILVASLLFSTHILLSVSKQNIVTTQRTEAMPMPRKKSMVVGKPCVSCRRTTRRCRCGGAFVWRWQRRLPFRNEELNRGPQDRSAHRVGSSQHNHHENGVCRRVPEQQEHRNRQRSAQKRNGGASPEQIHESPKKGPANMLHMYPRLARRDAD